MEEVKSDECHVAVHFPPTQTNGLYCGPAGSLHPLDKTLERMKMSMKIESLGTP